MMKQLKSKFVLLTMASLFALLSVIVAAMNIYNYTSVVKEADSVLTILTSNKGHFPGMGQGSRPDGMLPPGISPEIPYESRFFSVTYDTFGNVTYVDVNKIAAVDDQKAIAMAREALQSKDRRGFIRDYRYAVTRETEGVRVTFLDCGRKLDSFFRFCFSSILMSVLGLCIVFAVVFVLAGRIIRPIAESYEKQKRFITDAGHEIKTPLTIINANADLLEMELGEENESLADIKSQTKRLKHLTEDLVMLSRMEEAEHTVTKIDFPISEVVEETAHSFQTLAQAQEKTLRCSIEPLLTMKGEDKSIRQLVSILLDNALKYSPADTAVALTLARQNRNVVLTVSNETLMQIDPEQLKYVFDRFYRTDSSRNSNTGGHGIGLSIAKAIVNAHGGKIKAATHDVKSFTVTAVLPM